MRLGSRQRAVLDLLAHQRIAPPDDGMTARRLGQLTNLAPSAVFAVLTSLRARGLVFKSLTAGQNYVLWRLTDEGRKLG